MIQRYLYVSALPELRPDPVQTEADKTQPEIMVVMPVPIYWEILKLVEQMRYAENTGQSTQFLWRQFSKRIYPCILVEKDRLWYRSNMDF